MNEPQTIIEMKQVLEAVLLTAGQPLSLDELLRPFAGRMERATLRMLLDEMKAEWQGRSMELVQVASGWRFQARAEFAPFIARINPERSARYSRAALETLAIIAYRQPVTRGDIEEIRGVAVNPNIMRQFLERNWVDIVGQRDVPGRPSLYATTKTFLDDLGLRSLSELPPVQHFTQQEIPLEPAQAD
ncbi:SMC-Scp complex subunit ScpB [Methylobacillus gramineus]|uniref:SMC-Scp complex subunit ScpB n=1 Tax=Methylobacillus gramineus TaxID=755169 RepID=UPI001CFF57A8|nr:SMC-Scp complex subunit ScpB [Methylobacillus gramineus]MCB5184728.1 SMC-Scp complex subunit ScpB [Methylobacillus gramineus]